MSAKSSSGAAQEYIVKSPIADENKIYCMVKFTNVELKARDIQVKIERENNFKDYKLSHDIDLLPKFGAGSQFGREQKDEARRKKYGIMRKKYNPKEQPMLLEMTDSKQMNKYRGTKEGGVMQNASYYIFKQCEDGAFQLMPISEWYNFSKVINYKCLNSEEAEEEFDRRDRTLNYFSIMLKKRMKKDEEAVDVETEDTSKKGKIPKKKKKNKDFKLTDMDEWAILTDGSDDSADNELEDDQKASTKEKNKKVKTTKKSKKANSDEEAVEDSDDVDEGQEVDYITDSDSEDEDMYEKKDREDETKYQEKGVEDEEGLRKLVSSGDEDEEEEDKEKNDNEDEEDLTEDKKKESDSDSSSSSDSESDPEKQTNFSSALFMQSKKSDKAKKVAGDAISKESGGRSTAENVHVTKGKKRKMEAVENECNKKEKLESVSSSSITSEGITEEAVKRYLMRKPITIKDLIQKFKSKNMGMSKEQLVTSIAQILKRLNPDKTKTNDKLYLFIKKTE